MMIVSDEALIETAQLSHEPQSAASTQFVVFNLFGDYILPRGGSIWTNNLLRLLELLGIGERAARSTLARMKQEGWLDTRKFGRRTQTSVTRRGRAILEQGNQRIFEPPMERWDGQWRLVVYSLPEEKRELRNELRKQLVWYGFGNLAPGAWVSPHDRHAELERILDDLAVRRYVSQFTGRHVGSLSDLELVARCWDIPGLERDYSAFVVRHEGPYRALLAAQEAGGALPSPERCFVRRFWLTYDFQPFPRKDPNLPRELLAEPWAGSTARQLFVAYRRLLSLGMGDFMDELARIMQPGPG
jgi:phenylacetic acid degradation operon negative regulatory protein